MGPFRDRGGGQNFPWEEPPTGETGLLANNPDFRLLSATQANVRVTQIFTTTGNKKGAPKFFKPRAKNPPQRVGKHRIPGLDTPAGFSGSGTLGACVGGFSMCVRARGGLAVTTVFPPRGRIYCCARPCPVVFPPLFRVRGGDNQLGCLCCREHL